MAASDMLSSLQFNYSNGGGFHTINAVHPDAGSIGRIHWADKNVDEDWMVDPGEVKNIAVDEKFQRQGVASALWNQAKMRDPSIKHSTTQSPAGAAWAASAN